MNDLKKSIKLIWMKNQLWLIAILLLPAIVGVLSIQGEIDYQIERTAEYYYAATHDLTDMEDPNYWEKVEKQEEILKEQGIGKEELQTIKEEGLKKSKLVSEDEYSPFQSFEESLEYANFIKMKTQDQDWNLRINGSKILSQAGLNLVTYMAPFILALVLGGLEHLTSFYELKRSLPWKKEKDYFSKIIIGTGLLALTFAFYFASAYWLIDRSTFSEVLVYPNLLEVGIRIIATTFSIFAITFALGQLSGSFLGQIGLSIIGFSGWMLISGLIHALEIILFHTSVWSEKLDLATEKWPKMVQGFISPITGLSINPEMEGILGALVLSLILLVLGYFWHRNQKVERNGLLVLNPTLSKIVLAIAVVTTACIVTVFMVQGIFIVNSPLLTIPIFALILFLSYKFYALFFKLRIGV